MDTSTLVAALVAIVNNPAAILALTAALVQALKPSIEHYAPDGTPGHDLALRAANYLVNLGLILLLGTAAGTLHLATAQDYALVCAAALLQALGTHTGVVAAQAMKGVIVSKTAAAAPAIPDFPPGVPSLAALGLPVSASVSDPQPNLTAQPGEVGN